MYRSLSISMYSLNKTTMDDFTTSFKSDFITSSFIFSKSRLNCNWVIINSSYFVFVVENIVSQGVNMTLFVYPFLLHNYMYLISFIAQPLAYKLFIMEGFLPQQKTNHLLAEGVLMWKRGSPCASFRRYCSTLRGCCSGLKDCRTSLRC